MNEIITIQAGQCGNQVAHEYWKILLHEHQIDINGNKNEIIGNEKPFIFFNERNDKNFSPRAILVDSEPRVVNSLLTSPFYSHDSSLIVPSETGAGNNWAHGYHMGTQIAENILDKIQQEMESCDYAEAFNLIHSVAGGTGSGMGSYFIDSIRSNFPKKLITTCSVFPSNTDHSDTVVQPYNTVLSLSRIFKTDMGLIVDNGAFFKMARELNEIYSGNFAVDQQENVKNFDILNYLLGSFLSAVSHSIRFPKSIFANYSSLVDILTLENFKLITAGLSIKRRNKHRASESLRKLFLNRYSSISIGNGNSENLNLHKFNDDFNISCINLFYEHSTQEILTAVEQFRENNQLKFVQWMPVSFHSVSLFGNSENNMTYPFSAISLINSSKINNLIKNTVESFDKLKNRSAFLESYKKFDPELTEINYARQQADLIFSQYKKAENIL